MTERAASVLEAIFCPKAHARRVWFTKQSRSLLFMDRVMAVHKGEAVATPRCHHVRRKAIAAILLLVVVVSYLVLASSGSSCEASHKDVDVTFSNH